MIGTHKDYDKSLAEAVEPGSWVAVKSWYKQIFGGSLIHGRKYGIDLLDESSGDRIEVECRGCCPNSKPIWDNEGRFIHGTVHILPRKEKYLDESPYDYVFIDPTYKRIGFIDKKDIIEAYDKKAKSNPNVLAKGEFCFDVPVGCVKWYVLEGDLWRREVHESTTRSSKYSACVDFDEAFFAKN